MSDHVKTLEDALQHVPFVEQVDPKHASNYVSVPRIDLRALLEENEWLRYRVENRGAHLKAQIKRARGFKARIDAALAVAGAKRPFQGGGIADEQSDAEWRLAQMVKALLGEKP